MGARSNILFIKQDRKERGKLFDRIIKEIPDFMHFNENSPRQQTLNNVDWKKRDYFKFQTRLQALTHFLLPSTV